MCVIVYEDFSGWSIGCVLGCFIDLVDLCNILGNVIFLFKFWKGIGFICLLVVIFMVFYSISLFDL